MKRFCLALTLLLYLVSIILPPDSNRLGSIRAATIPLYPSRSRPLTLSQIEKLVKNKTPDNAIATEIRRRGISFQLNESILETLLDLGAGAKTIAALRLYLGRPTPTRAVVNSAREEINKWLMAKGYVLYEPLGLNLPPASVFIVKDASVKLVMTAQTVLPSAPSLLQSSTIPESIDLPKINLTETYQLPFLPHVDVAALTRLGAGAAIVQLSGIRVDAIPLSELQDAIKHHPKLKEKQKSEAQDLFVVFEVLRATQIKLTLLDKQGSPLGSNVSVQNLKMALGSAFNISSGGTGVLSEPLSLGIKAADIFSVSTILGGGREELRLKARSPNLLRQLFGAKAKPITLYSSYQVFGLVIGLGNYNENSERIGGTLPGATASAKLVAGNLRRLVRPGMDSNIQIITSRKGLVNFDKSKPLSKAKLNAAIDKFVRYVKSRVDPKKESVVFFYYFGHGLAQPYTFYLVPEDYKYRGEEYLLDSEDDDDALIDVDRVHAKLDGIPSVVVLMIDSCREIKETDDLARVRAQRGQLVMKSAMPRETENTIDFQIDFYGSYPILFGGDEGANVPVVKYPINGNEEEIGPLSLRLHLLFNEIAERKETITLGDFIVRMQEPVEITLTDGNRLKSYTPMVKDFLDNLPAIPLLSTSPQKKTPGAKP